MNAAQALIGEALRHLETAIDPGQLDVDRVTAAALVTAYANLAGLAIVQPELFCNGELTGLIR